MLHVVKDEFSAGLAALLRVARREELERHRSPGAAAGCELLLQWIWAHGFPPGLLIFTSQYHLIAGQG